MENNIEAASCPYIVFRVDSGLFTVNSANVMAIREMPNIEIIPEAPVGMRGIFMYMDCAVPMLDLRTALGKKTLDNEYKDFVAMLEQRKQDHYHWVEELNRSVQAHEPFTLATDPHKCAFGKWYYEFKSDNNAINHHMRKIEEPHRLLHESAFEATACKQEHDKCKREKCVKDILNEAEHIYAKAVVDLIEEAKEVMKDSFREMALVIEHDGKYYGLAVDEVLSVEEVEDGGGRDGVAAVSESPLVKTIKKCPRYDKELIIELDENKLLEHFNLQ
ncbi:MAG: chemotaxis protein CheW [Oscillospiraceae bacterium]